MKNHIRSYESSIKAPGGTKELSRVFRSGCWHADDRYPSYRRKNAQLHLIKSIYSPAIVSLFATADETRFRVASGVR